MEIEILPLGTLKILKIEKWETFSVLFVFCIEVVLFPLAPQRVDTRHTRGSGGDVAGGRDGTRGKEATEISQQNVLI